MKNWIFGREHRKIILYGLCLEVVFGLFYFIEPLRKIFEDTTSLMPKSMGVFIFTVYVLAFAFALYFVSAIETKNNNAIKIQEVMFFLLLFSLTLLFIFPIGSIDIFSYIYRARVHAIHHLNPYFHSYNDLTSDYFYSFINNRWSHYTTLYGPIFVIISSFLAYVGKSSVFASLFLLKGLFIILHVINAVIIGKLSNRAFVVLLYAWNPLILFEFVINGHNEVMLLTFMLLGLYFLIKKNSMYFLVLSFLFFFCAFLVKATAIVFIPLVFVFCLFACLSGFERIKFIFFSIGGSFLLSTIFFYPFWEGVQTLMRPVIHSSHVYDTFAFASLFVSSGALYLNFFGLEEFIQLFIYVSKGLFIFSYGALLYYIILKKEKLKKHDITKFLIIAVILFYFFFFTWLMPWYYTILITLILIYYNQTNKNYLYWSVYGLTLFGILYYVILR